MAKQSSILRRSKVVENRVQRYLWPGTSRAWKERWDVGCRSEEDGWECIGEVKSRKVGGLRDIWTKLSDALEQAEGVAPHAECWCFAVLFPPSTQLGDAFVMYRPWGLQEDYDGTKVVLTLSEFAGLQILGEHCEEEAHAPDGGISVPAEVTSDADA